MIFTEYEVPGALSSSKCDPLNFSCFLILQDPSGSRNWALPKSSLVVAPLVLKSHVENAICLSSLQLVALHMRGTPGAEEVPQVYSHDAFHAYIRKHSGSGGSRRS
jgi:hypothetical protein